MFFLRGTEEDLFIASGRGQCPDGSSGDPSAAGECVFYPQSNLTTITTNCAGFLQKIGAGDLRADPRCKTSRVYNAPGAVTQPAANAHYDSSAPAPMTPTTAPDSIFTALYDRATQGGDDIARYLKYAAVLAAAALVVSILRR